MVDHAIGFMHGNEMRFLALAILCLSFILSGCDRQQPQGESNPTLEATSEPTPEPTPAALSSPAPPAVSGTQAAPNPLTIMSYNIEWFPGRRWEPEPGEREKHMTALQIYAKEVNPDLTLLSEIHGWEAAEELVSVLPGFTVHVTSDFAPRPQNLVVASRLNADSAWVQGEDKEVPFAPGRTESPRGYAFAAIELDADTFLLAYSLHLKSNHGDEVDNRAKREEAVAQILRHADKMLKEYSQRGRCVLVIAGDFNTSVDDERFQDEQTLHALKRAGLKWGFENVPFAERITIPASGPYQDNCFDHIFYAGAELISVEVPQRPEFSDHNPVITQLDWTQGTTPELDMTVVDELDAFLFRDAEIVPEGTLVKATELEAIRAARAQRIAVQGVVRDVSQTSRGHLKFVIFEDVDFKEFVLLINERDLEGVLRGLGLSAIEDLIGKSLQAKGRVTFYEDTPQIVIRHSDQIEF
ncbi:MAG: endonuclease/exonuclease/phosphatase family protein [Verrucomicrobiales bacterium]